MTMREETLGEAGESELLLDIKEAVREEEADFDEHRRESDDVQEEIDELLEALDAKLAPDVFLRSNIGD